tara:strand:- start:575 stop:1054 length:480 start_codon:yes stop_codon:yes gene_type:complete
MKPTFNHFIRVENGKPVGNPTDKYSAHFTGEKEGLEMGEDGIPLCFEPFLFTEIPADPIDWKKDHLRNEVPTKLQDGTWTRSFSLVTKTKAQQKAYKDACTARIKTDLGYTSWTWNDDKGTYEAPIPPTPESGPVWWFEEDQAWLPFTIDADGNYEKAE